ncbi:N-6 DNA Methylase family protein [Mycobacterium ulcerans str. Harvey]|uniref:site-specific DNA-methyltransferase (adenine-specific) n=1 Tax=Mycobacterium ulcerans str. Harvey TaxID=1299332 RepID=A0ABP3ARS8_MYCUL|nr:N-6 DNA Methylase family protein [Mycobacterium ulcerans str. Harvey]
MLKSLKSTGKAAIILPHGVLFRGHAEATIRRDCSNMALSKGSSRLPPNLFYGTGIPTCIVILDKENATGRTGVFMIDASTGFMKDGPKNRLRSQDIHKIVDTFNKQVEIERYSRLVPLKEIADCKNDYNLNIPRTSIRLHPRTFRTYTLICTVASPIVISMRSMIIGRPFGPPQRVVYREPSGLQRSRN